MSLSNKRDSLEGLTIKEIKNLFPKGHWIAMSQDKTKYASYGDINIAAEKLRKQGYQGTIIFICNDYKRHQVLSAA
jgi:hypothetical protein